MEVLHSLEELVKERARHPNDLDLLGRSDQEEQMEDWLDQQGIEDGWEYAPLLVNLGYEAEQLNQLTDTFPAETFSTVIQWLEASYSLYNLLEEISQGSRQMSTIIKVLKSYVYLDQAPVQLVDIHEGLDNTLVMLRSRLKGGITVRREYDPQLPRIQAYGSELNQVWTNIIANALDSLDDHGELVLRTSHSSQAVTVEIQDNGPGIPADIQPQLFSPFFTTKPMGKGTGLGLNISYNIVKKNGGEIKFLSEPGLTCFVVNLPVNFEARDSVAEPISGIEVPSDEELLSILTNAKNIAVVGISDHPDAPAHTVPAYLQQAGYQIYPVNPRLDSILGEKAFPDLLTIQKPVDIVLVFRRSEFVPEIVQQAIQIKAGVVWMQEGIINDSAALVARNAGLQVVMNTCMRVTHRRLLRA
jgi:predicted CoA-binding protein